MWYCRVCGLDYDVSPWGEHGTTPNHSFCECCGVEFGYQDCHAGTAREYRQQWLMAGSKWFYPQLRPAHWQLAEQLGQVPPLFT